MRDCWLDLETRAAGAIELAQRGDIRAVGADAAGVHGQTEIFRLLDAQAGLVQFGEAVAFRGHEAIAVRKVHGTRRAMRAPPFPDNQEEVVPVSSIPHAFLPSCPGGGIGCTPGDLGSMNYRASWQSKSLHDRDSAWPRRAAPGTGAVPMITPEAVESRLGTLVVAIKLSADCARAQIHGKSGRSPRLRQRGVILS